MYYSHFGLSQPPFRITPNTEFFYGGGNRGPILEALKYAIGQGEGIIKVTGEVGSGKTMLCSMLQAQLPPNVETVYIVNPSVTPLEILHAIAQELHLDPPRGAGHLEVMQLLHHYLLERHAQDKQVVMFVEESQSMPIATLEEIRLLSNLETAHSKLLQIVLFGQPELEDNLRQPHIRQLRDRITHSFRLSPLKHDEIRDYLKFRLYAAGYRGPDLFSPTLIKAIAKASDGLTRRINLIADKALLAAFSENTHTLKRKHIRAAVRDSEFSNDEAPRPRIRLSTAAAMLAAGTVLGIALFALYQASQNDMTRVSEPVSRPVAATAPAAPPVPAAVPAPEATPLADDKAMLGAASPAGNTGASELSTTPVSPSLTTSIATPENLALALTDQIAKPDKARVSANSQTMVSGSDTVEMRLAASQEWLAQQAKNTYSIQLMGVDNPQQLKNQLNKITKYIEINEIYVYRTIAKQKPSLTVLYGSFGDRKTALDALRQLPESLRTYKPLLRTVEGIRAEIARNQSS